MSINDVRHLVGYGKLSPRPVRPFDSMACDFLDALSKQLFSSKEAMTFPDIVTFAFWCRKGSIDKLSNSYKSDEARLGRGIVFHIAPSNIPVNFAFSWAFGLLSGNGNIVRVPSKEFPQIRIICSAINKVLENDKYERIRKQNTILSYDRNDEITANYSKMCDARIIWGGDKTINAIRKIAISPRTVELAFADRYSLCIIDCIEAGKLSEEKLKALASNFYNDTFLNDQNACSTPHLIVWLNENKQTKSRFYEALFAIASKYDLADIKVSDKYNMLCNQMISLSDDILSVDRYENLIYSVNLKGIPDDITLLRGQFGLFFNYSVDSLKHLECLSNKKIQTIVYFGIDETELAEHIISNGFTGVDRIVPIGKSMDMGLIWDGYNIIDELSRIISFN